MRHCVFTDVGQALFAAFSGDDNPEHHLDAAPVIVFGGLIALALCAEAFALSKQRTGRCQVFFAAPASLHHRYSLDAKVSGGRTECRLHDADRVIALARLTTVGGEVHPPLLTHHRTISGVHHHDQRAWQALLDEVRPGVAVPEDLGNVIALASYVLGMAVPGLGRFAGIDYEFDASRAVTSTTSFSAVIRDDGARMCSVALAFPHGRATLHVRRYDP